MLKQTKLGSTDISVSPIGLGTVKFGRDQQVKYPDNFMLPSDSEIEELLEFAKEVNVNVLDTAPAYGTSEERLGKLLKQREDWVIVTKVGEEFVNGSSNFDFTPKHIISSVERSLRKLKTDYLDVVLVHSSGDDVGIIQTHEVFVTLERLKRKGLIRAFGMSCKTIAGGIATVEQADVAMVTYNPINQEEKLVLDKAYELNKGIFIKKAFASGHLNKISDVNPIKKSIEFIFQHKAVNSIIIGTINPEHFKQNVDYVLKALVNAT